MYSLGGFRADCPHLGLNGRIKFILIVIRHRRFCLERNIDRQHNNYNALVYIIICTQPFPIQIYESFQSTVIDENAYQFLIGTIYTLSQRGSIQKTNMYQFLIGTIYIKFSCFGCISFFQYQFLIGTIYTVLQNMIVSSAQGINSL